MMRVVASLLLVLVITAQSALAGRLDDFEREATEVRDSSTKTGDNKPSESDRGSTSGSSGPSSVGDALTAEVMETLLQLTFMATIGGVIYGGAASMARNGYEEGVEQTKDITLRKPGEALLPIGRVDVGYQAVESGVSALDVRGEVGYALIGLQVRHTHYWESQPSDQLSTTQIHGLYRMALGNHAELDLGFGTLLFDGNKNYTGFSFTSPLLIHPSEHFGVEFRPAWSNLEGSTIQDYDLALLAGGRYASLKAGYRWVRSGNASLNGPELGVVLRW